MQRLIELDAVRRLREGDPTLFTDEVDRRQSVKRRLGWTDLAEKASARLPLLEQLSAALVDEGVTDVVLLGMGGSSLAPLVFERVIGSSAGMPRLHVVDTTFPGTVLDLLGSLEPSSTAFLVSSKSGTTVEPLSLYAVFREWADEALEHIPAGKHFIVITDPDGPLDVLRKRQQMRTTLSGVPTVGGRYSALSMFGLTPAALMGVDLPELIARAQAMETACWSDTPDSPGAQLAAWLADNYENGRDKLTLACSPGLAPFGLWVEQLVAESTGKDGRGIVPVIEPDPRLPSGYGDDRAVVVFRFADDEALAKWGLGISSETPAFEIVAREKADLGAEFVRWEVAVALTGVLMGVNPFDEPNVTEAKEATRELLAGGLPVPAAALDIDGAWVTYAGHIREPAPLPSDLHGALRPLLESVRTRDYLAALAYLPEDETLLGPLRDALAARSSKTGVAACLELGPRYLHSTGQLHKGGPDIGAFLIVTARDRRDVPIPGQGYGLAALFRAQAEGDLATLGGHGARVMRIDLPDLSPPALGRLAAALRPGAAS